MCKDIDPLSSRYMSILQVHKANAYQRLDNEDPIKAGPQ